ncbi:hypothetical protein ACSE3M_10990 [Bacillus velezensis]
MILAVCEPGEPILIQRNCHKSVFHAVALAGAKLGLFGAGNR